MSIEINEDLEVIEITETLSWKHHVLPVIHQIREELENWYDIKSEDPSEVNDICLEEDLKGCKNFLDDTKDDHWNKRWIKVCLDEIVNEYEREYNYALSTYEPSIFNEELIRNAVENFIEEEWEFDPRV
jgi:hypothetical protein